MVSTIHCEAGLRFLLHAETCSTMFQVTRVTGVFCADGSGLVPLSWAPATCRRVLLYLHLGILTRLFLQWELWRYVLSTKSSAYSGWIKKQLPDSNWWKKKLFAWKISNHHVKTELKRPKKGKFLKNLFLFLDKCPTGLTLCQLHKQWGRTWYHPSIIPPASRFSWFKCCMQMAAHVDSPSKRSLLHVVPLQLPRSKAPKP